jgi:4-amino-4-deoxy-L-arabinose transferase-like glycosyltransferase
LASTKPDVDPEADAGLKRWDLIVVGCILVASALLKIAYTDWLTEGQFSRLVFSDESSYYLPAAQGIIDQGFSWFLEPRSLWTGPLNPLWIAAFGANIIAVKLANVALWVGSGLLLFAIARHLFGRRAGILTVVFYSVSLPFFVFTPTLLTEPVFTPLLLLWIWLFLVSTSRGGSFVLYTLSGLVLGLAALTRSAAQFLALFLVAIVVMIAIINRVKQRSDLDIRILWRSTLLILLGVIIVVVPYTVKNLVALDRPVIANGIGAVLYLGSDLRKNGDEPIYSNMNFDTFEITTPYAHFDTEGDTLLMNAALAEFRQHPVDVVLLQVPKGFRLLFGSADHYFWPYPDAISYVDAIGSRAVFNLWDMAFSAFLVIFGVIGMLVVPMTPVPRVVLIGTVAYFAILHTALFPIPRMVMPILPILAIFAASYFSQPTKRFAFVGVLGVLAVVSVISFRARLVPEYGVSERYVGYFDNVTVAGVGDPVVTNSLATHPDGLESNGQDPYLVYDVADFDALVNQIVFIDMRAEAPPRGPEEGLGQVFWSADGEPFSAERSADFTIRFGAHDIYAISPSFGRPWDGRISQLRIDFPEDVNGARYEIIRVQVRK